MTVPVVAASIAGAVAAPVLAPIKIMPRVVERSHGLRDRAIGAACPPRACSAGRYSSAEPGTARSAA
jgi:hypothetical protein